MHPLILFSLFFLFYCNSFTQLPTQSTPIEQVRSDTLQMYNWAIQVAPLSLLDVANAHLVLGIEKRLSRKVSFQQSIGFRLNYGDIALDTYKGFRSSSEIRYHFHPFTGVPDKRKSKWYHYAAFEVVGMRRTFEATEYFYDYSTQTETTQIVPVRQNILVTNLKYGYQKELEERFLVDFFFGLGMRAIFEKHQVGDGKIDDYREGGSAVLFYIPERYRNSGSWFSVNTAMVSN